MPATDKGRLPPDGANASYRHAGRRSIATDPPGAEVSLKGYADVTGEWKPLGRTPIANARLARGVFRWKVVKEGFEPLEFIGPTQLLPAAGLALPLAASGSMPPNMVAIPRSNVSLTLTGHNYTGTVPAGDFLIDKYEVTNRQIKEFVDAGGYAKREYWKQAFVRAGRIVPWELAVGEFRDRTGRPGPSTWEVGTYPAGQDNYPVGGVSWYEAAAYAEFAGKSLPTVYHWLRAAGVEQAAYITPLSNLDGRGPAEVGSHPGVTPAGAFDMAGNVKEWCWNEMANRSDRYLLGGAWSEPPHMFQHPDARSPFDRSETNGFRLVKYVDAHPLAGALTQALEAFRAIYAYDARPLDARTESVDDTAEYWVKEKVSFRAAYGDERVTAYLFVPKHVRPPFQTVVYAPGAGAIQTRTSDTLQMGNIDFLMVSGRAVLYPVYQGTYERNTGQISSWPEITRAYQDWLVQVLNDARRAVDYLETRDDVRQDKLAYQGFSWGAAFGVRVLAMEPRFKAAVLLDGGLSQEARVLPQVDSFNYAPRVALPVLMVNGSSDFIFPVETSQKPLWAYLGTPPEHKRHVTLPGGHGVVGQQRSQVVREVLNWVDRYLGPVQR